MGLLLILAACIYGFLQLAAGFAGIEYSLGFWWAIGAVIASLGFRFTLPITVGAFYGAMNVWGWQWALALIFAAPGLCLMVPGVMIAFSSAVRGAR